MKNKLLFLSALLGGLLLLVGCGSTDSTPQYTLTVTASPPEGGSVSPGVQVYDEGSTVRVTATANPEWLFMRWEGDYSDTTNPASLTMDADKAITAIFEKKTYPLTVTTQGEGTVTEQVVTAKPTDYESGTVVELTAVPAEGWTFVEWQGALSGTANPQQLIVDQAKQVKAVFEPFYLDANGVTVKCETADEGETGTVNGITYTKRSTAQITQANAETTCTSGITDMSILFLNNTTFDEDISSWDVSSVTSMLYMFSGATAFNEDISMWNVSSVTDMNGMFFGANSFNGDLSNWNVSSVTNMNSLFRDATAFNGDISAWNVSNVTDMSVIFSGASSFNGDISAWDVSSVTSMFSMFSGATAFNEDISAWNVSSVSDMRFMFFNASSFNQDLSGWCVTGITSEPDNFSSGSPLTNPNKPVWGTCPGL